MVLRKLGYEFKRHLSDSTAIVTFFNPLSATLETAVAGMSDMVSLKSRAIAAMLTYGGLANLTKVRDWSKNLFRIGKESSEKTKYLHDALFAGGCVLTIRPMIYLASGETDWKKIAIGTAGITGLNLALGGPAGYSIDVARDLTGVKECDRRIYPRLVRERTPIMKKAIAASLIAASIGIQCLTYHLTPDKIEWGKNPAPEVYNVEQQAQVRGGLGDLEKSLEG